MVTSEDRELRNAAQKCIEGEMRVMLLEGLLKKGLGLKEIEDFVSRERGKLRRGGGMKNVTYRKHREIVKKLMGEKLRDSKGECTRLRREKTACLKRLEGSLKGNKREVERIKKDVKNHVQKVKNKLKTKYEKKIKNLEDKYGLKNEDSNMKYDR